MSSPRVLRIVVTSPASMQDLLEREHARARARAELRARERIERDQVELARHVAHAGERARAPARRQSLTPSSITYSKVTKSRGARSR